MSLASAAAIQPRTLTENDIVVWGANGRVEVMSKTSYALLTSNFNLTSPPPTSINATTPTSNYTLSSRTVSSRCSKETIFTLDTPTTFLNWDVPMSSVLKGNGDNTLVAVTAGYTISNSISVGESTALTPIKDFLTITLSIDYTESWSSTRSDSYTFKIPDGKYGAVVSNPKTTRNSGRVDIGCVAEATETTYFMADSYSSKAYGGLSWVEGIITLCTGDTYPLPMCVGDGTLS